VKFGAGFWGPFPRGRYVEYALAAERLGFDSLWIGDTQLLTPDLYSAMALCANATSRITIGSGVTNTVTRDLTVTAGGALALSEFSGGRCVLGVGVGGSAVGTVGLTADGAAEFRRKLALVKALVAGETATVNGVEVRQSLDVVVIAGSAIGPASAKAVVDAIAVMSTSARAPLTRGRSRTRSPGASSSRERPPRWRRWSGDSRAAA